MRRAVEGAARRSVHSGGIVNASPMPGQRLAVVDFDESGQYEGETRRFTADVAEANVITSMTDYDYSRHRPVLDIDLPVTLIESSTPGHYHLLIDKPMSWATYSALLEALAAAGVVERGYAEASITRGHTAVRLPWVKK